MENSQNPVQELDQQQVEEDEISLLELLIVLAKRKKMIAGWSAAAAIVSIIVSSSMPNIYTGKVVILPPQQDQSAASAMLGQLAGLAGRVAGPLGIKNPNDLYIGMLQSHAVADSIIARLKLKDLYKQNTLSGTYRVLAGVTNITSGKDGLITIEVKDKDPKVAADIANAYPEALGSLTNTLAVTGASQRRLFFEKELKNAKDQLATAEVALKQVTEKSGGIPVDAQGAAAISAVGEIRAQIAAKEVELAAARSFATENNPDFMRVREELAGLKAQLAKLEKGSDTDWVSTHNLPEAGLEYIRKMRDVKYYETLFQLMAQQFEMAKLDEARDYSNIQVLDKAIPPDHKSGPARSRIVILSTLGAFFLAVIAAFLKEVQEKMAADPEQAVRLGRLRQHLKWR